MPQLGWIVDGEYWLHQDYMDYLKTYPVDAKYTPDMLDLMFEHEQRNFMSPTMFTGCVRQEALKRLTGYIPELDVNYDGYYVEVDKAWAAARGTIAHLLFETAEERSIKAGRGPIEGDALIEDRFAIELEIEPGVFKRISGKPDKLVPEGDGTWLIIDYKTVEDEKVEILRKRPKSSWISQLSSYKYILHHHGIEVSRARLQMVSMKTPMPVDLTDKLWSFARVEGWLRAMARKYAPLFDGEITLENLPAPLDFTLDSNAWLCRGYNKKDTGEWVEPWCAQSKICFALQEVGR